MLFKAVLLTICIGTCFSNNASKLKNEELTFLNDSFKDIPEQDRKQVLYHHLFLGYLLEHQQLTPEGYNLNETVTKKIYEIFLENFKSSQALSTICFASGTCIDPSDSGIYP